MECATRIWPACKESLRYSRFLWTHIALTTIAGGALGLLPFSLCLKGYAESLVSVPLGNSTASLSPSDWAERDTEAVNQPAFLLFWFIKNTWCAVGEYMPMLLALHGGHLKTRVPLLLALVSMVTVTVAETLPVWLWGNGWAYNEGIEDAVLVFKYLLMFLVNTLAVAFAESSAFRCASLLPIVVLTGLPLLMHLIQDACIGIYLSHRTWYARLLISGALMSAVRPVLLEVSLVASERLACLQGAASQSRLGVYVAISCTALVHALQVSSDGPWETALVYSYMMFAEVGRNHCYLRGNTELTRAVAVCEWCLRYLRSLFVPSPQEEKPVTCFEDIAAYPVKPATGKAWCLWQPQVPKDPHDAHTTPRIMASTRKSSTSETSGASMSKMVTLRSTHVAVTGDLVAISNIMEGSLIVWISIMFLTVKLSPYEVAGEPLAWEVIIVNCLMGLFIEALTDFVSYAIACAPGTGSDQVVVYREFDTSVGIGGDKGEFLWIFTVVLAISMETVGHMYEELCPTQVPGTTLLMSLSVCPAEA